MTMIPLTLSTVATPRVTANTCVRGAAKEGLMTTYSELLRDPRWQKDCAWRDIESRRVELSTLLGNRCHSSCSPPLLRRQLQAVGVPAEMLVTLCERCHKKRKTEELKIARARLFRA